MLAKLAIIVLIGAILLFGWRRTLSYLRYFQQEDYNGRRFVKWLLSNRAFDTRASLTLAALALISLVTPGSALTLALALVAAAVLVTIVLVLEPDPRKTGKIKLNLTERAKKTALIAFTIQTLILLIPLAGLCCSCSRQGGGSLGSVAIIGIIVAQLVPWLLIVANTALSPIEKRLQRYYLRDAKRILAETNPYIVGITGSYGKTGAKAALGDLFTQTLGSTFWPRKGINTVMGITRTIRESMRAHHRYAVIEMGAYNIGSIKRLCDLTPPKAALVTAVGIMHLERFGSPENVYKAKSELAQALPADGILVCNGDSPNARRMALEHRRATTLCYGLDLSHGPLDCYATDIAFSDRGTSFVIHHKGERYPGHTPLLGRPALSNALGAFTMVCALGASPAFAAACLGNLPPVDNRLVLDRGAKVSYLRDAYNSNPTGFEAALEVLQALPARRRILMTPGMIELGEVQYAENKRLAGIAASLCDLVIVVGSTNREAIMQGLLAANFSKTKIITAETRDEAFTLLAERETQGDLVLIENDLGDLHEGRVRF